MRKKEIKNTHGTLPISVPSILTTVNGFHSSKNAFHQPAAQACSQTSGMLEHTVHFLTFSTAIGIKLNLTKLISGCDPSEECNIITFTDDCLGRAKTVYAPTRLNMEECRRREW